MKRFLKTIFFSGTVVVVLIVAGFSLIRVTPAKQITWGVDFSQKHAQNFSLDWQEVYLAILEDLRVKNLKISTAWDLLEPKENEYSFFDLDWQLEQAQNHGAKTILVIGMKTPRWPECHLPNWAKTLSEQEQQNRVLELLKQIVLRYRDNQAIFAWQVENEPLFYFGDCPKPDISFLKKEIALVKSLDFRPVIISDSGEQSFWLKPAKLGDIVGTTMYRRVWSTKLNRYIDYPLSPSFYAFRRWIIEKLFHKKIVCVELQTEPWGKKLLYDIPVSEQLELFDTAKFIDNIEFAKNTGFDTFYFWGGEWWYWLKKHGNDSFWQLAKDVIKSSI